MPDQVEPLVNVKEDKQFLADQEAIERALAAARRFAKKEPFKDEQEAGEAADAIKAIANARIDAEKHKLERTAEWRATTGAFNAEYKELNGLAEGAERALKQKGVRFLQARKAAAAEKARQEQARLDKAAEDRANDAAEAAALAAAEPENEEAQELADEVRQEAAAAAQTTPAPPPPPPPGVRGGFAKLSGRKVYTWELDNLDEVPREFLMIDPAKVKGAIDSEKALVKAGGKPAFGLQIPGVTITVGETGVSS